MKRFNIFWITLSFILAMLAATRPGEIGADYYSYAEMYGSEFRGSIEPAWWVINKVASLFVSFSTFLFLLTFILLIWVGNELDPRGYWHKYIFVTVYFPVFFLGHLRSGLVAILILIFITRNLKRTSNSLWLLMVMPLIHFSAIFVSLYLFVITRVSVIVLTGVMLILVTFFFFLVFGEIQFHLISFIAEDLDRWRIVGAFLQGELDNETRSLFMDSPRFFFNLFGLFVIAITYKKWVNSDISIAVWCLLFSFVFYITFSSIAIVAQKGAYIVNPVAILVLFGCYRSSPLRLLAGSLLLYDLLSLSLMRFVE